ncbi:MAG: hypothetical protein C0616_01950 [Desulfuromonas sp.]|nr:MAG: hypothetical protein C0616_01950 [Desulfuromonas sp.]
MTNPRNEQGMVLLLVLVVTTLLAVLLSELAFSTLVDLRLTETFRDSTRAYHLAKGGVTVGRMALQMDRNSYDAAHHSAEYWAVGVQNMPVADGFVSIEAVDLDGRLNLNRAVDELGNVNVVVRDRLLRLAESVGITNPEQMVAGLVDWIDGDDDEQLAGAEERYYQTLPKPYHCKNAPLDTLDELLLVRGVEVEDLKRLKPHVTIFGDGKLNVNSASGEVLQAWDAEVREDVVEGLVAMQKEAPIESLSMLKEKLGVEAFSALNRQLDLAVTSRFYEIRSQALIGDGTSTVTAVIDKTANNLLMQKVN